MDSKIVLQLIYDDIHFIKGSDYCIACDNRNGYKEHIVINYRTGEEKYRIKCNTYFQKNQTLVFRYLTDLNTYNTDVIDFQTGLNITLDGYAEIMSSRKYIILRYEDNAIAIKYGVITGTYEKVNIRRLEMTKYKFGISFIGSDKAIVLDDEAREIDPVDLIKENYDLVELWYRCTSGLNSYVGYGKDGIVYEFNKYGLLGRSYFKKESREEYDRYISLFCPFKVRVEIDE